MPRSFSRRASAGRSSRRRRPSSSAKRRRPRLSPSCRDPNLLARILEDFETGGLVGEDTNKLTAYLAAVSRKLDKPLAVIIQSSSAAGKSALMEAVLGFVPEEEREKYSALTGQSLFYIGEGKSLQHKILAIAEEEGAEQAGYALKLLQSEGELSIASTGKDPQTGRLVTQEYRVEGPVMIFLTTTAIEIDEELLNRCLVLTVDESREQTRRIHELQRRASTLDGMLASRRKPKALKVHRNAQRLLRPLLVHNPYAARLTFLDEKTRMRRDHVKYLKLIEAIALLFQYQREVKSLTVDGEVVEYVEATVSDVALANRLASEVLGRSLDELPPQTRRLLVHLDDLVTSALREARCRAGGPALQPARREGGDRLGRHAAEGPPGAPRRARVRAPAPRGPGPELRLRTALRGEGKDGSRFLPGLLDVTTLAEYDGERSGFSAERSAPGRPSVGGWSGAGRGEEDEPDPAPRKSLNGFSHEEAETPLLGTTLGIPSYPLPEPKLVLRRAAGRL